MKNEFRIKLRQKYHTDIQHLPASKKRKLLIIGRFLFKKFMKDWYPNLQIQ